MVPGRAGRGQHQTAAARHQTLPGRGLELLPNLIGAQHQWHELAPFANRLPRDARFAMRRTLIVRRSEAVDADGAGLQLGGLIQRSAADRAQTDDEDVCS